MVISYSKSSIKQAVRRTLDQNTSETQVLTSDAPTLELDDIIEGHILTAARNLLANVPLPRLIGVSRLCTTINSEEITVVNPVGMGEPQLVSLPADFLRVYDAFVVGRAPEGETVEREGWHIHLTDYEECSGAEYAKVNSAFPGIKPNPKRPKLFLNRFEHKFEFYGCSHGTAYLKYIPIPQFIQDNGQDKLAWPVMLYDALIYTICALVEASYKNTAGYQLFSSIAANLINVPVERVAPTTNKTSSDDDYKH